MLSNTGTQEMLQSKLLIAIKELFHQKQILGFIPCDPASFPTTSIT